MCVLTLYHNSFFKYRFPVHTECYITGLYGGVFNHAYKTKLAGVCDYKSTNEYSFCTRQV